MRDLVRDEVVAAFRAAVVVPGRQLCASFSTPALAETGASQISFDTGRNLTDIKGNQSRVLFQKTRTQPCPQFPSL